MSEHQQPSNESDDVRVNFGDPKGVGHDVIRKEANARTKGQDREAQGEGEVGGGDGMAGCVSVRGAGVVSGKGCGCGGVVGAKVEDLANGG